jgi:CRISPR-associated endonuclease/helicase Cas3
MANAVFIFDEIQTLPVKCVHLYNSAANFLHEACGSTFLLCTATQPLLDRVCRPLLLSKDTSIVKDINTLTPLRTRIVNRISPAGYSIPELTNFILSKHERSTLVIVNTKAVAKALYCELAKSPNRVMHLSTNMCPEHRDDVIKQLRDSLAAGENVICVSTQLIEAGVNISFKCVIRDIAGLDSIYQAAGRCNRHGEFGEIENVYVVNIAGENLDRLPDIKIGAKITQRLFDDNNLDIDEYYRLYFYNRKDEMDYRTKHDGTIYDLLTANTQGFACYSNNGNSNKIEIRSAIRSASDEFFVIESRQTSVIVPYGEGGTLLHKYMRTSDLARKRELLRKLARFSVALYDYQVKALDDRRALTTQDGLIILSKGFYHEKLGVDLDGYHEFLNV